MANENKLTTLAQMREFAQKQDARDDQQEEQIAMMVDKITIITTITSEEIDAAWENA